MNAFDISSRRRGAPVRPQPVKSTLSRPDLPQTFENRVMHSWAVAGHWLGVLDRALHEAVDAPDVLGEAARWQIEGDAKRIRARLALAAGHAMGADMLAVVRIAAAVELLHEASLVHDDLQDRDTLRRGKNTVWVEFGEELAITLGDWMINPGLRRPPANGDRAPKAKAYRTSDVESRRRNGVWSGSRKRRKVLPNNIAVGLYRHGDWKDGTSTRISTRVGGCLGGPVRRRNRLDPVGFGVPRWGVSAT